ncbi:MAG: hypothetical protein RL675_637, partial [Bacteroidota bacterium]
RYLKRLRIFEQHHGHHEQQSNQIAKRGAGKRTKYMRGHFGSNESTTPHDGH